MYRLEARILVGSSVGTPMSRTDRLPVEDRVGQEADAGGGVVVDRGVPSTGKGPLKDPRRLAHLAMADRRDHGRQDHRAHQQDDQDHDQQLDQREPAPPGLPPPPLIDSLLPVHRSRPSEAAGRLAVLVADVVTAVLAELVARRSPPAPLSRRGWSRRCRTRLDRTVWRCSRNRSGWPHSTGVGSGTPSSGTAGRCPVVHRAPKRRSGVWRRRPCGNGKTDPRSQKSCRVAGMLKRLGEPVEEVLEGQHPAAAADRRCRPAQ